MWYQTHMTLVTSLSSVQNVPKFLSPIYSDFQIICKSDNVPHPTQLKSLSPSNISLDLSIASSLSTCINPTGNILPTALRTQSSKNPNAQYRYLPKCPTSISLYPLQGTNLSTNLHMIPSFDAIHYNYPNRYHILIPKRILS